MCRGANQSFALALALLAWPGTASAQGLARAQGPAIPDDAIESYLADHGLLEVLAARLRARLAAGPIEDRLRSAELLGRLYVEMLGEASSPDVRQELESRSADLLRLVPEAESFELRINLAKATYLQVEEIVEKDRLRLARPEDKAEADRVLRLVGPQFAEIAAKLHRRVETLEARETRVRDSDTDAVREELAEARRLRSLAKYYSGWTEYYTALLSGTPQRAARALEEFGAILNALPGKPASLERLPKGNLRFDHVARAALGCALCVSMLGEDVQAVRWIEAVEGAEGVSPAMLDQAFTRRLIVFAAAGRWADVELAVRRRREPERGVPATPLTVAEARLLAVLALEASREGGSRSAVRAMAERMAQAALGDLVKRGEAGHVLDLVGRYGTEPLGGEGFIVGYVRSLQAYEAARAAHAAAGGDNGPATDPILSNRYADAARLLRGAAASADAGAFPGELARVRVREGLALFYAGELEAAARRFEAAAEAAPTPETRRDAMWYAIVTLDRAVRDGRASLVEARDRLATLYLKSFPGTENAARLLLRQARADRLTDAESLAILQAVPKDSPLYEASRRQASRLLYQAFRRAAPADKEFAALRFAEAAEELLRLEQAKALGGTDAGAKEAARSMVVRVRQLADALLAAAAPDLQRVRSALEALEGVAAFQGLDLRDLEPELTFRRLQMAVASGDEAGITALADRLTALGGPYATSAGSLQFNRAVRARREAPLDPDLSRKVVTAGERLLGAGQGGDQAATLRESVADAAAMLWRTAADASMRDLALRLDREQLAAGRRTGSSLRRVAELAETAGDRQAALDAWQELLLGLPSDSRAWFEARYHSIRLVAMADRAAAVEALRQLRVLHPGLGPDPWASRFLELERGGAGAAPTPVDAGGPQ